MVCSLKEGRVITRRSDLERPVDVGCEKLVPSAIIVRLHRLSFAVKCFLAFSLGALATATDVASSLPRIEPGSLQTVALRANHTLVSSLETKPDILAFSSTPVVPSHPVFRPITGPASCISFPPGTGAPQSRLGPAAYRNPPRLTTRDTRVLKNQGLPLPQLNWIKVEGGH